MKEMTDIIERAGASGKLDLSAAAKEMAEALDQQEVLSGDLMMAQAEAQHTLISYIGSLVLTVAEEVGALPNGIDEEMNALQQYIEFTHVSALYQQVYERTHPRLEGIDGSS